VFETTVRSLARVFLNAAHVQARPAAFAQLLQALGGDFLPRTLAELTPAGVPTQRVGAATANGEWSVHIVSESIDVTYSPRFGTPGVAFGEFCDRAAHYLRAAQALAEQPAHRVALVREGIDNKSPEQLEALATRLLTKAPPFEGPLFEWDWRVATRIHRTFGNHAEELNTIGILKRVEVTPQGQEPVDRLWVSTDINTPPSQRRPRFSADDSAAFVNAAAAWHAELDVALQTLVEGN
jgi:hypothetical protein